MKIKYEFVKGNTEIEVSEEWGSLLIDFDKRESLNNRTETRRHTSIQSFMYEGEDFAIEDATLLKINGGSEDYDLLYEALDTLTEDQRLLIQKIFIEDFTVNEYAEMLGVDASAVSHRIRRIKNKIKKFYRDRQI